MVGMTLSVRFCRRCGHLLVWGDCFMAESIASSMREPKHPNTQGPLHKMTRYKSEKPEPNNQVLYIASAIIFTLLLRPSFLTMSTRSIALSYATAMASAVSRDTSLDIKVVVQLSVKILGMVPRISVLEIRMKMQIPMKTRSSDVTSMSMENIYL